MEKSVDSKADPYRQLVVMKMTLINENDSAGFVFKLIILFSISNVMLNNNKMIRALSFLWTEIQSKSLK